MFTYKPVVNSPDQVVWYGGASTQLHYECGGQELEVRTLGNGIPTDITELLHEMEDFYLYCTTLEVKERMAMAD
jgi:hypothetical protein